MTWLKDPLVIFLVVGAGIFMASQWLSEDDIPYTIEIQPQDMQRLNDQWSMQMRRPPTEVELAGLLEQFIKEEIYYREAQRLGLDRNDTIVRRRMVQKLTFLTEDIATATPLDEAELNAYYQAHKADYQLPERFSFRHRYFSSDRRADANADATTALTDDNLGGDPFMLQRDYAQRSAREIGDLFGRMFADALSVLAPGEQWQGPLESAYGWHAVQLKAKTQVRIEAFDEVRARVVSDAQQDARKQANESYFSGLKARYDVLYPGDV